MAYPVITPQTITAKQGVPFDFALRGENISNTTIFDAYQYNIEGTVNRIRATGFNPRLTFTPNVYGSNYTINISASSPDKEISYGAFFINVLPQKPVIAANQLVIGRDGVQISPYYIKGKNIPISPEDYPQSDTQWTATRLPSGLSLNANGYIQGTPTQIGSFATNFRASNPSGTSAPVAVSIRILPQAPVLATTSIAIVATQNVSITPVQLRATSKAAVTWTASQLPKGIVLSPQGVLSGTPRVSPNKYTSRATVKNSGGSKTMLISFQIKQGPPVISSTAFTTTEEAAFSFQIRASNSPTRYSIELISNNAPIALPPWVVFNTSTGLATGTTPLPSAGTYTFRVTASNSAGMASKDISVRVNGIDQSVGTGTFTNFYQSIPGVVYIYTIFTGFAVKLDDFIPVIGSFGPNLTDSSFILGHGYYIMGNPVTKCPPGTTKIQHPGKFIYHAYGTSFGSSYKPAERKGTPIVPGKTFRQLGFSQGLYRVVATWIPSLCARAAGFKVTYSNPIDMTLY
jgi:hypothetical protein